MQNFPAMLKSKEDGIDIYPEKFTVISNYIFALSEEFKRNFRL